MSPVAADCPSADSAPGALAPVVVVDRDAEVVVVFDAPRVEVVGGLLEEDPQPTMTIAVASATTEVQTLFMPCRLAI